MLYNLMVLSKYFTALPKLSVKLVTLVHKLVTA